jgi:hypothetical protein
MDELNFDKIFKQKMAEERDFPYSDEKWDKMEKQIDNFKAQKRQIRFMWALSLPFLGLLGLLFFMTKQLNQTQSSLHDLMQEVQLLRSEKPIEPTPSVQTSRNDTVYHHIIVKRYDTVFQTVVQRTLSERSTNSNNVETIILNNKKAEHETFVQKPTTLLVQPKSITSSIKVEDKTQNKIVFGENKVPIFEKTTKNQLFVPLDISIKDTAKVIVPIGLKDNNIEKQDTALTISPLDAHSVITTERGNISEKESIKTSISIVPQGNISEKWDTTLTAPSLDAHSIVTRGRDSISNKKIEEATDKTAEMHKPILKPIKLSGYEIGLSSGVAFIGNNDILRQMGYTLGARGTIGLGQRLKIVGDAQYLALSYDLDKLTGQHDIPTVSPPTPDDELKEIKVEQPTLHFALGLQYDLTRSRLRPFVGVGAVGELKLEESFNFQFKNRLTKEDIFVRTRRDENAFNMPYLRFNTGVAYPIFKKLKVHLEGNYDIPFETKKAFKPLWQVKGVVLYRF